jgi:hypothetical protein
MASTTSQDKSKVSCGGKRASWSPDVSCNSNSKLDGGKQMADVNDNIEESVDVKRPRVASAAALLNEEDDDADSQEEEELFDESNFEEESTGHWSVQSDELSFSGAVGIMRLEHEFVEAQDDIKLPLWFEIARFLDRGDLKTLDKVAPLKGYGLLVRAERRTKVILDSMEMLKKRGYLNCEIDPLFQLDTSQAFGVVQPTGGPLTKKPEHFYSWSALDAELATLEEFKRFCEFAGVDDPDTTCIELPIRGNRYVNISYHFLSSDRKVIFSCREDPRRADGAGKMAYLGVTGERSRVMWLLEWFKEIGIWSETREGLRHDHDPYYVW